MENCASKLVQQEHALRRRDMLVTVSCLSGAIVLLAFLPTMVLHNGRILLHGDFVAQQVPFMTEARRCILSGTPFWSWNTFLGANFIGSYSFYVYGSPFFWPLLLLPEAWLTGGITVMFVLKHITAAVGAALYLEKYVKNRWYAVLGGLLYAFSFFTIDSSFYYHFLDVIALFPFFMAVLDRMLAGRRRWSSVFILLTFLLALTNYYFFIAICFFFLFYLFYKWRSDEMAVTKPAAYLWICVQYACGALLAAFVLIPSALSLLETNKAIESFNGSLLSLVALIPQIPMLIKGLILPSEGIAHSGVYFMFGAYCSNTAFLPLTGAVLFCIGLRAFRDDWEAKLTRFLLLFTIIPLGNGLFSLFSNLAYTRWWFMLVLMLALVTVETMERLNALDRRESGELYRKNAKFLLKLALGVTLPFVAVRFVCAYLIRDLLSANINDALASVKMNKVFDGTDLKFLCLLLVLTAVNYLPLLMSVRLGWMQRARRLTALAAAVCLVNYGAYMAVGEGYLFGEEHITVKQKVENALPAAEEAALEGTDYTYRSDTDALQDNFSMLTNRPGLRTFNSFKSFSTTAFGRRIGYEIINLPTTNRYFDTPAIQALLSIREFVSVRDQAPKSGYTEREALGNVRIYDADHYVPFGYVCPYYLVDDSGVPEKISKDVKKNNKTIETMVKACYVDSQTAQKLHGAALPCPKERLEQPWQEAARENAQNACDHFQANTSGFSAVTSGEKMRLLVFSVPHDDGWCAFINGKEAEILTVNYGLMGVVVPPGEQISVVFRFEPPGLKLGAIVSATVAVGLLSYGVAAWGWRRKTA